MTDWKNDIRETLANMMPYAFTVNDHRIPMDKLAFDEAVGYVNEQVFLLMKRAYKCGFIERGAYDNANFVVEAADFVAERAFEDWMK